MVFPQPVLEAGIVRFVEQGILGVAYLKLPHIEGFFDLFDFCGTFVIESAV